MSRTKNLTSTIALAAVIISAGVSAYERSQHSALHVGSTTNSSTPSQVPTNGYPGSTAPELANASCHANQALPDATCTAGVINPNVTQDNIQQTICVSGYTKTIRPAASYTDKIKAEQMSQYGYTDSIHAHEEDHLISLELGGSPDDPKNLWPEPHASPNPKDKVENYLHAAVCSGRISLHDAQARIATDWTTAQAGL
jgi:hypothetical protein